MSDTTPEKVWLIVYRLVPVMVLIQAIHSITVVHNPSNLMNLTKTKVTRRSVACKSCHSLKVKCTPSDPNNPSAPCVRCINANRICEIDLNQTRKRRKKSEILEAKRQAGQSLPEHKKRKIHLLNRATIVLKITAVALIMQMIPC